MDYVAVIHKDADSDYGVSFPDFPGCVSAGATAEEAIAMGREALTGHVGLMMHDGLDIPAATPLDEVAAQSDGILFAIVSVEAPKAVRAVRINVTLPSDVLTQVDSYAETNGFTRSGFLAHAAKKAMAA